tara:strand:+ start:13501 stop:14790 length:1290 start_codon:yes stop_codon:yes gene_type:complete
MADYFVDSRATGANDGAVGDAVAGTTSSEVVTDAWQSIADIGTLAAGDTVTFVRGSGPYEEALNIKRNGTAAAPMKWYLNGNLGSSDGVVIRAGDDLNAKSGAQWVASSGGTNEYYFTISGGNPTLVEAKCGTVNNYYRGSSAEAARERQTPGSITTNHAWGWGDNDTLGYSTIYIRVDSGTPADLDIIMSQRNYVLDANWNNHIFYDADFRYGNFACVRPRHASGTRWDFINPFLAFAENEGINVQGSGRTNVFNPRGSWCGHRFVSANYAGTPDLLIVNGVERGAHLSFLLGSLLTGGSFRVFGFIGEDNEAGAMDFQAGSSAAFEENNNCWYPRMTASAGALAYNGSSTQWPRTSIIDVPDYHDTTESNQANLIDPEFKTTTEGHLNPSDFELKASSPLSGRSIGYVDHSASAGAAGGIIGSPIIG